MDAPNGIAAVVIPSDANVNFPITFVNPDLDPGPTFNRTILKDLEFTIIEE